MNSDNLKGKFLEEVVEQLHTQKGIKATKRVRMPITYDPSLKREIDVLLEYSRDPYPPIFVAVECKNYGGKITVKEVGDFKAKLDQIGLPSQGAIMVSANGYQRGALSQGKHYGFLMTTISGLSKDQIGLHVQKAIHGDLYLAPFLKNYSIQVFNANVMSPLVALYDEKFVHSGYLLDLVWKYWLDFSEPKIGEIEFKIRVCGEFGVKGFSHCGTQSINEVEISGVLHIVGHLLVQEGRFSNIILSDSITKENYFDVVKLEFTLEESQFSAHVFSSFFEFETVLKERGEIGISLSVHKSPKIEYYGFEGNFEWAPTEETFEMLKKYKKFNMVKHFPRMFSGVSKEYQDIIRNGIGNKWPQEVWDFINKEHVVVIGKTIHEGKNIN